MALVTLTELKSFLRVTHALEDALITGFLAQAKGVVEVAVGVPITAASRAWQDRAETQRTDRLPRTLLLPYPLLVVGLTVVDGDGTTVPPAEYDTTEVATTGELFAARGMTFGNGPYQGTATIGLSAHPDYAGRIEPIVNAILTDIVAWLYQNRNPAAVTETDPGVSVTLTPEQLPPRIRRMLTSITPVFA